MAPSKFIFKFSIGSLVFRWRKCCEAELRVNTKRSFTGPGLAWIYPRGLQFWWFLNGEDNSERRWSNKSLLGATNQSGGIGVGEWRHRQHVGLVACSRTEHIQILIIPCNLLSRPRTNHHAWGHRNRFWFALLFRLFLVIEWLGWKPIKFFLRKSNRDWPDERWSELRQRGNLIRILLWELKNVSIYALSIFSFTFKYLLIIQFFLWNQSILFASVFQELSIDFRQIELN